MVNFASEGRIAPVRVSATVSKWVTVNCGVLKKEANDGGKLAMLPMMSSVLTMMVVG